MSLCARGFPSDKNATGVRRTVIAAASLALWVVACGHDRIEHRPPQTGAQGAVKSKRGTVKKPIRMGDKEMEKKLAQFAPVNIGVEESAIPEQHRPTLKKLVAAARIIDRLFFVQVARENPSWRENISAERHAENTLAYFDIMYGPWDRLDHDTPFWGAKGKPRGAAFYPEDMTVDEFAAWIAAHPEQAEAFKSYFTIITRNGGALQAVPYSKAYQSYLQPAAVLLEEAAKLAEDNRLATYLRSRSKAFGDNAYRASDMDWMDLGDGDLEVVFGPYEVYEDELLGYKTAFEAFIALRDPEASRTLARIKAYLPEMERALPIPAIHRNAQRGQESPISVVDVLFTAGDTRAGVQTLAFNLPNDEVVREKKGSKKVLLRNVSRAKFTSILLPIANALMRPDQVKQISFEAFFNHTLMHETAHGLGPGKIAVSRNGIRTETSVNEELRDLYSVIEEAKADVLGMYLNLFLVEKGLFPESLKASMYASFLAGFFRSVRFGASEAHGLANVIQFNYFIAKGAITKDDQGRYAIDADTMPGAVERLANALLMIEALGDYDGAKRFIATYGTVPQNLHDALAGLAHIPTDIRPLYPVEMQMKTW